MYAGGKKVSLANQQDELRRIAFDAGADVTAKVAADLSAETAAPEASNGQKHHSTIGGHDTREDFKRGPNSFARLLSPDDKSRWLGGLFGIPMSSYREKLELVQHSDRAPKQRDLFWNGNIAELQKVIASIFQLPQRVWAPKNRAKPIDSLKGFYLPSETNTEIQTVLFQLGDKIAFGHMIAAMKSFRAETQFIVLTEGVGEREMWQMIKNSGIQNIESRVKFIRSESGISSWARDPFIILFSPATNRYSLLPFKGESGTELDRDVARQLMQFRIGHISLVPNSYRHETLDMQGGDIRSDEEYVYVGEQTVQSSRYNIASAPVLSREEAISEIERITGKTAIILNGGDIHNDRYHIPLGKTRHGNYTSLLADPVSTLILLAQLTAGQKKHIIELWAQGKVSDECLQQTRSFLNNLTPDVIERVRQSEAVKQIEQTKKELERHGIKVIRIPGLPDGITDVPLGIYYTNALMDSYRDKFGALHRSIIMPEYGIQSLDELAKKVYRESGFDEVRTMPGMLMGCEKGGPRCLVQTVGPHTKF